MGDSLRPAVRRNTAYMQILMRAIASCLHVKRIKEDFTAARSTKNSFTPGKSWKESRENDPPSDLGLALCDRRARLQRRRRRQQWIHVSLFDNWATSCEGVGTSGWMAVQPQGSQEFKSPVIKGLLVSQPAEGQCKQHFLASEVLFNPSRFNP